MTNQELQSRLLSIWAEVLSLMHHVYVQATIFFWILWEWLYTCTFRFGRLYLSGWITEESSHHLSLGVAWVVTLLITIQLCLFILKWSGKALQGSIELLFIEGSSLVGKALWEVVGGIVKTCWHIITFLPKALWRSIFKSPS